MSAFVLNTQTLAVSDYSLTPVGVAVHGGETYFVGTSALSKQADGAPDFDAYVETGEVNLAPGKIVTARIATVLLAADGPVELTVGRSTDGDADGLDAATTYTISEIDSLRERERTVILGRGAKAAAWTFRLGSPSGENVDWSASTLTTEVVGAKRQR